MASETLALLQNTVKEYRAFANKVRRPALKQFMYTIIDYIQRQVEVLEEGTGDLLEGFEYPPASSGESLSPAGISGADDDLEGLKAVLRHIRSSVDYFGRLADLAGGSEAGVLFAQYRDEAVKLARLVEDRLELETL
jgi:hypothetical protein